MLRLVCKSKIQPATVTEKNLQYRGSIVIDENLMQKANILPYEIVMVINLNNGERFETYVIPGRKNSGIIALQGGAARLGEVGDQLIIISYAFLEERELKKYKPKMILLNEKNRIKR
jgi:aspartate 1-decarboxylase